MVPLHNPQDRHFRATREARPVSRSAGGTPARPLVFLASNCGWVWEGAPSQTGAGGSPSRKRIDDHLQVVEEHFRNCQQGGLFLGSELAALWLRWSLLRWSLSVAFGVVRFLEHTRCPVVCDPLNAQVALEDIDEPDQVCSRNRTTRVLLTLLRWSLA